MAVEAEFLEYELEEVAPLMEVAFIGVENHRHVTADVEQHERGGWWWSRVKADDKGVGIARGARRGRHGRGSGRWKRGGSVRLIPCKRVEWEECSSSFIQSTTVHIHVKDQSQPSDANYLPTSKEWPAEPSTHAD